MRGSDATGFAREAKEMQRDALLAKARASEKRKARKAALCGRCGGHRSLHHCGGRNRAAKQGCVRFIEESRETEAKDGNR